MKPNFHKILSIYLKLLILHPDGIIISEEELNSKLEYNMQQKFVDFFTSNLEDIGYYVNHNNRIYTISKNVKITDNHWE